MGPKAISYDSKLGSYTCYDEVTGGRKQMTNEQYEVVVRRKAVMRMMRKLGAVLGVLLLVLCVAAGIGSLIWMESNDYAGMDQKKVTGRAYSYLHDWFGQQHSADDVKLVSFEQRHYGASAAWRIDFAGKSFDDGKACMYIWEVDQDEQEYIVKEGSAC